MLVVVIPEEIKETKLFEKVSVQNMHSLPNALCLNTENQQSLL